MQPKKKLLRADATSKPPTLAMLWVEEEETLAARLARIISDLDAVGHCTEAAVLEQVQASVSGDSAAAAKVASMAKLIRPKRGRGRPRSVATSMFPMVCARIERVRAKGADDVAIARGVIALFVRFLGPSSAAASLLADAPKLARLANADAGKFVLAIHRALKYPGTDNITAAARVRRSREYQARTKTRAARRAS